MPAGCPQHLRHLCQPLSQAALAPSKRRSSHAACRPSAPPRSLRPCRRKRGTEFLAEFYKVLPRALRHVLAKGDDKTRAAVNKVIRVWDERKVGPRRRHDRRLGSAGFCWLAVSGRPAAARLSRPFG